MTVFVATWGMDYEQDSLIAVCYTLDGAKQALVMHVAGWTAAAGVGLMWEALPNGGACARFQDNFTATVVPVEVTE